MRLCAHKSIDLHRFVRVHVQLTAAKPEGYPAPGHVCWHDLNMYASRCLRELKRGRWQLIYISNMTSGQPEREEETRVFNMCVCVWGLDVALPCRVKGLAAGRLVPVGYRADFSWQKRNRGWTAWWLDTRECSVHLLWSEYRGVNTPSGQHVSKDTPALLIHIWVFMSSNQFPFSTNLDYVLTPHEPSHVHRPEWIMGCSLMHSMHFGVG